MNEYSRAMYRLLAKQDLEFRYGAKEFHLGKSDCDAIDRFAFLFLCKKMLERGDRSLSESIYTLRKTGFRLTVSEKNGVCIRPTEAWNTAPKGAQSNGLERFKSVWFCVPLEKRTWIKKVFENMPEDFPEFSEAKVASKENNVA